MGTNCKHPTCEGPCRKVKVKNPKKPIRRISAKGRKNKEEKSKLTKEDHALYMEIWNEREHVDFETDEIIPFPLSYNFHHVLPKKEGPGGYPQYRHCKWNIVLVGWSTHDKAERNVDLVPKIKAYRDKLLKEIFSS